MAILAEVSTTSLGELLDELLWFAVGFAVIRVCLALGFSQKFRLLVPSVLRGSGGASSVSRQVTCRSAAKSILASASAGQHAAVLDAWRKGRTQAALPIEALQAVAQALASLKPECLADELTSHVAQHIEERAWATTVNALLENLAHGSASADLMQELAVAVRQKLQVPADTRTYEILLGAFAAAGDENKVEELLESQRFDQLKITQRGYSLIVKGFVRNGKLEVAARQVLQMGRQNLEVPPRAITEIFRAACSEGPGVVQLVLDQLADHAPLPAECIALVLSDCAQRDDIDMASRVEKLAQGVLTYGAYEPLLKLHAKTDGTRAIELLNDMQKDGFFATEGLCGCLLARCAETQNLRLAEAIASYLRERSMMSLAIYKTLMRVYACCGLYDRACDLYEQVCADGLKPDHVMYGCLVKFAVKCGRTDLSHQLFDKANGGDVQNYMWLIRCAGKKGDVTEAMNLLRRLEATQVDRLDIAVYNCTLDACVTNNDMERASELLSEVRAKGMLNLVTFNTLIKGHCGKGDLTRARCVLREMEQEGYVPDGASYNCIISAAVSAGNFSAVWDILDDMDRKGVVRDHYTVSILMKAAKKAKNPRDASRALAMLDREDVNVCEDDVVLNTVLDACIHQRDFNRLNKVLRSFEVSGMRPSVHTYGLLIRAFGVLSQQDRCRELWTEMVELRGVSPNDITLSCMLDALIGSGQVEEAVALFEEWKAKVPPNTVIYSTLIKGFASRGEPERAMEMYRSLRAEGLQMNFVAYTTLIDAHARVGNMQRAVAMLRQMEEDGCRPNTITYSTLVKGYCMQGDLEEALHVFDEMLGRGLAADTVIFNIMLDGCVRHSSFELADQLLADIGKYSVEPSNFTLSIMVKMWGKRRRLDDAFATVHRALKEKRGLVDAQVGTCLMSACFHNRDVDRALQAFEEIKTWSCCDGPDAGTYGTLIAGLARAGCCHKAVEIAEEARLLAFGSRPSIKPVSPETMNLLFKTLQQHGLAETLGRSLAARVGDAGAWKQSCAASGEANRRSAAPWQKERW